MKPMLELPGKVLSLPSASCVHLRMFRQLHTSSGLSHFGQEISMIQPAPEPSSQDPKCFQRRKYFHVSFPPACTLPLFRIYSLSTSFSAQTFPD